MTAPTIIKLMPKQWEFVHSDAPEILYSGAYGAGKSRAACYRVVRLALRHPSARVGLIRVTMTSLRRSTMKTLLKPDGDLPPVLDPSQYHHSKIPGDEEIRLVGGGVIVPFGVEDVLAVGSIPLTDIVVDEAIELNLEQWNMAAGRARVTYTLPDGTKHVNTKAAATNPGDPSHFLYDMFYKKTTPNRHLIEAPATENWYLPPGYFDFLDGFVGPARLRYRDGVWCAHEGAIYPMYFDGAHVLHLPGPFERYVGGVDYGFKHPSSLRIHGLHGVGCSHVVAELYEKGLTPDEFADACEVAALQYSPLVLVVDPSCPALIKALRHRGFSVVGGDNDVLGGIGVVQNALMPDNKHNDGKPRLTFEPSCDSGNREYPGYHWKKDAIREQPEKINDDACDADRYAMMYIARAAGTRKLRTVRGKGGEPKPNPRHRGVQERDGVWRPLTFGPLEGLS